MKRKEESLLERTNSWKPFIDEASSAITARDYRKETVKQVLRIVDPTISMYPGSFWRYVKGTIIGAGFPSGRILLYEIPVRHFISSKGKVFENAPLEAIQAFNKFMTFLFPPDLAKELSLSEELARRIKSQTELLLEKGKKAQEILAQKFFKFMLPSHKKEEKMPTITPPLVESPAPPEKTSPPELFSIETALSEETQQTIKNILSSPPFPAEEASRPSKHSRQVVTILEEFMDKASLARQNALVSLSSPQFFIFKDLVDSVKNSPLLEQNEEQLRKFLTEQDLSKITNTLNKQLQNQEKTNDLILQEARKRTDEIKTIQESVRNYQALLQPLLSRADSKERATLLQNQLNTVDFPDSFFKTTDNITGLIRKKKELAATIIHRVETEFQELIVEQRGLIRAANYTNLLLYGARWEIVSGSCPYPDLSPVLRRAKNVFLESLNQSRAKLANGEISLSQYTNFGIKAIYEPDILLVRGELTARSLRLKDIRTATISLLSQYDRNVALCNLAGIRNELLVHNRDWIATVLFHLSSPYDLFQDTSDPDSINILFRYWWLDHERFVANNAKLNSSVFGAIAARASELIRPIARTLDRIEALSGSSRPPLYQKFMTLTAETPRGELGSAITNWISTHTTSLTETFVPQLASLSQTEQDRLIQKLLIFDERILETIRFAKDIQAIKTFEPDRISSLLEVFSLLPFSLSVDQSVAIRLEDQLNHIEHVIDTVEEEFILELGLLDPGSRIQSGTAINDLMPQALVKSGSIMNRLTEDFQSLQTNSDPYVSSLAHFMLEDMAELTKALNTVDVLPETVFALLQKVSFFLLSKRLLKNALLARNSSSLYLLPFATEYIIRRLRILLDQGLIPSHQRLVEQLDTLASSQWPTCSPNRSEQKGLATSLLTFITQSKLIFGTSGLSERREARLIEGMAKVLEDLEKGEDFTAPKISFVPGDLNL